MTDEQEKQPKIIVDDDWKEQVQKEKEDLQKRKESKQSDDATAHDSAALPPASFSLLVTTLATQAMAALGQVPDPIENKPVVRLELAKHYIDTLGVLEEKTKGNLSNQEAGMLEGILHELRMLYVGVKGKPNESQPL